MKKTNITVLIAALVIVAAPWLTVLLPWDFFSNLRIQAKYENTESQMQEMADSIIRMESDGHPQLGELSELNPPYFEGSLTDSWNSPIHYSPTTRTLTSAGADQTLSTGDDLSLVVAGKR
ncbi:hypothetical protein [Rubritalea squalenifaciens]|nr:hypothetical protein [Rubritalea squalenifaciens]